MLIGLSLSYCVIDLVRGVRHLEDVIEIQTAIRADTEDAWNAVLDRYCQVYWSQFQEEAVRIAERLRASGKIKQPRLTEGRRPNIAGGHWVTAPEQIKWHEDAVSQTAG